MHTMSGIVNLAVLALAILVVAMSLHHREGPRRKWGSILAALLLILPIGVFKPADVTWIGWLATAGRLVAIAWLAARLATPPRV